MTSDRWYVCDCVITGGIYAVWARDVTIAGCSCMNPTTKPCLTAYRSTAGMTVVRNAFSLTQMSVSAIPAIMIQGTGTGSAPSDVAIAGNTITVANEHGFGVRAEGCLDVRIEGNTLDGPNRAAAGGAGVYLRATNAAEEFASAVVRGNIVRGFGDRGLDVRGNGAAKLRELTATGNMFDNLGVPASMTRGIVLDDGTGALRRARISGNQYLRGVAAPLSGVRAELTLAMD